MEKNDDCDEVEQILYGGPNYIAQPEEFSMGFDAGEVDSVISHESSFDGAYYLEESSEQSNGSSNLTVPEHLAHFIPLGNYFNEHRYNPKSIADLHGKKSKELGDLVRWINETDAAQFLRDFYNIGEYNNELEGIFIQQSAKEFKQNHGFDEAHFPFDDSGGPQRTKLKEFGYIFKYWVGKQDRSYKMRKFYVENGFALFVVFRDATSPAGSPSASGEVKPDPVHANKKQRVGNDSPFKSPEYNSPVASPSSQSTSYSSNTNHTNATVAAPTNYSQQVVQQHNNATGLQSNGTNNNSNNPLLSSEHLSNKLTSLSQSVDQLASRVTKLELVTPPSDGGAVISITNENRKLCGLIIKVLRENGGRFKVGSKLASAVRMLVAGPLDKSVVNNLLYTVLAALRIVERQDNEWVLIDNEKAKQFDNQN